MSSLREAIWELPDAIFADLWEGEDAYLLVIDLPGTTAETVDVRVSEKQLRIEGRRKKDIPPEFQYRTENRSLFIDISSPIPLDATGTEASATIQQGVLTLRLPKTHRTEVAQVPVTVTDR